MEEFPKIKKSQETVSIKRLLERDHLIDDEIMKLTDGLYALPAENELGTSTDEDGQEGAANAATFGNAGETLTELRKEKGEIQKELIRLRGIEEIEEKAA